VKYHFELIPVISLKNLPESYPCNLLCGHCDENRPRARPSQKWPDSIKEDCSELELEL